MMARLLLGDALTILATLPAASVRCCVTSPPYWGLRDYGVVGQIGLERTPAEYVERMLEVFREVRRVLTDDGTLWLNLGDSYAAAAGGGQGKNGAVVDRAASRLGIREGHLDRVKASGLKSKDLVGIPWRVAFALQADGWYLRSDIIWHKPNPMPESVTDRPTKSHEYLFLLSKSERYYYDADAIAEPAGYGHEAKWDNGQNGHGGGESHAGQGGSVTVHATTGYVVVCQGRIVWTASAKSDRPRIMVHDDVSAARRQITRIVRANEYNGIGPNDGYAIARVRLEVEQVGEPVKVRPKVWD